MTPVLIPSTGYFYIFFCFSSWKMCTQIVQEVKSPDAEVLSMSQAPLARFAGSAFLMGLKHLSAWIVRKFHSK